MDFTVFQTWRTDHSLPLVFEESVETWRQWHPNSRHRLLDHEFVWGWLHENRGRFPGAIHYGQEPIRTIDMFRYCYLLAHGGLYVDLDYYCLKPMTALLRKLPDAAVLGSIRLPARYREYSIPNSWMFSAMPGHPLWLLVLALAAARRDDDVVERATGPILLLHAVQRYLNLSSGRELATRAISALADRSGVEIPHSLPPVIILPPDVLHPMGFGTPEEDRVIRRFRAVTSIGPELIAQVGTTPRTHAFTYYYQSWRESPEA